MTGPELRAARETLGLTRPQLAAALGITGSRAAAGIENWEAGRRAIPAVVALAMRALVRFGLPETWPAD